MLGCTRLARRGRVCFLVGCGCRIGVALILGALWAGEGWAGVRTAPVDGLAARLAESTPAGGESGPDGEGPEPEGAGDEREDGGTAPLEAEEESGTVLELRAVRVDGDRVPEEGVHERSPERVDTISGEDLRASGARTLEEALRRVSGTVSVTPTGTVTGVSVDGLPPSQLEVQVDGRPFGGTINSPAGPVVDLATLPVDPERIERIDVHRGVGPAGSGGRGGVVVNIITRPPEGTEGAVALQQGLRAGNGELAYRQGRGSVSVGLGDRQVLTGRGSWLWRPPLDVDGSGTYDTTAQRVGSGGAEWTWRPEGGGLLRVGVEGWGQRSDVRRAPGPPPLGSPPEDRTRTWTVDAHATGRWRLDGARTLDHVTQVGRTQHSFVKVVAVTGEELPRAETTRDRIRQSALLTVPVGSFLLQPEAVLEGEQVGREGETGAVDARVEGRGGAGLNTVWWPVDPLEVETRVFGDVHSAFGLGGQAGAGAAWTVSDPVVVRGGASVARRWPSAEERYLFFDHSEVGYQLDGNPDLDPERLVTVRLGALARDRERRVSLEAEGFVHWLDDAVEPVLREAGTPAIFSYANVGRVRTGGVNASGRLALPLDLSVRASWTWLPVRESGEDRSPRQLTSEHGWNGELRWRGRASDRVGAVVRADGRSDLTVPPGPDSPGASWTLDAAVWAQVWGPLTARLDGSNLLDRVDAAWGPKPGRVVALEFGARW